jgi:hypothetical protein
MIDIIIAVFVISGIIGIKKKVYGAAAGAIIAPLIDYVFHSFDLFFFIALFPIGFLIGWISGSLSKWFFSGFRGGKHNTGPSYTGRAGGHQRGGIVFTDEEMKNAKENKNKIE